MKIYTTLGYIFIVKMFHQEASVETIKSNSFNSYFNLTLSGKRQTHVLKLVINKTKVEGVFSKAGPVNLSDVKNNMYYDRNE